MKDILKSNKTPLEQYQPLKELVMKEMPGMRYRSVHYSSPKNPEWTMIPHKDGTIFTMFTKEVFWLNNEEVER